MKEMEKEWLIEPLNKKVHDRRTFSCGEPNLDSYIKNYAPQDEKRNLSQTFVATNKNAGNIGGYYTLSATSFYKSSIPAGSIKNLPDRSHPAVLLGRLAVHKTYQNCGLGTYLLVNACTNIQIARQYLGIAILIVDASDENIVPYYQKLKFVNFSDNKLRLFLPMSIVKSFAIS